MRLHLITTAHGFEAALRRVSPSDYAVVCGSALSAYLGHARTVPFSVFCFSTEWPMQAPQSLQALDYETWLEHLIKCPVQTWS